MERTELWGPRMREPKIGGDRAGVPCDECRADNSCCIRTRHSGKVRSYSLCRHCIDALVAKGYIW